MKRKLSIILLTLFTAPSMANADLISAYLSGKVDYVQGTGGAFENLETTLPFGVEAGVELLGMELWGEALIMGDDQYLMTANFGFGIEIGGDIRITAGAYTGPMFFKFNPEENSGLEIPSDVRAILDSGAVPISSADIEAQYNEEFADKESTASEFAAGWNLLRGRFLLEYSLLPFVTLGVGGHAGYHFVLSGDDAVADLRGRAIDTIAEEYKLDDLDSSIKPKLKEAVGAKPIDESELKGVNYNVGAFLKVKL